MSSSFIARRSHCGLWLLGRAHTRVPYARITWFYAASGLGVLGVCARACGSVGWWGWCFARQMLSKWAGKEEQLFKTIADKYKDSPDAAYLKAKV